MRKLVVAFARISMATIIVAMLCAAGLILYSRSQGLLILSVQTGSMRPAINPGDAVLVRQPPVAMSDLRPGDIISYRNIERPDVIITHRLVSIDRQRNLLVARGDSLQKNDTAITSDRIVGVVTRTIPLAGYGFDFLRNPVGLAVAVYLPSLALIVWEIRRLMRSYARQRYTLYSY